MRKIHDPARAKVIRRTALNMLAAVVFLSFCTGGVYLLRGHVEKRIVFPDRPAAVVMINRPAWMSDFLADQVIAAVRPVGVYSSFDARPLRDVHAMLRTNPWVKQVRQIRRAYVDSPGDTIEIDCEFRAPIALVHWKDYYWLVDGEGVKLPEQYTVKELPRIVMGANRKLNIRVIEGVQQPPVESGQQWPGPDLQSGLELVKLLHGKPFADDVVKVNVSNYGGRISQKEAQLVLVTRWRTEVRWGRPISSKDFFVEVSANQKLKYMQQVYEQYHRVDGNFPWIDIRFDKITYPSAPQPLMEPQTAQLEDER